MEVVFKEQIRGEYSGRNYYTKSRIVNLAHHAPLRVVFDLIRDRRYGSILDIGCADGIFLPSLAQLCDELQGADLREERVRAIDRSEMPHLHVSAQDVQDTSFESGYFDLVVCLETLEHVPDPHRGIAEIARVLKPGSRGVISVPIEIGLPALVKDVLRRLARYPKKSLNSFGNLMRAVVKRPNTEHHVKTLSHQGFDYRMVLGGLAPHGLRVVTIRCFPLNLLGPNFNSRIIILFEKD